MLTRRAFLKLGLLTLGSLAFRPFFGRREERAAPNLVRITIDQVDVRRAPSSESPIIGQRFRDQLVTVYQTVIGEEPAYNPRWYRVWGGYIHSAYTQSVQIRFNPTREDISSQGSLIEITVPFTEAFRNVPGEGWKDLYRLYYQTTHWVTGIEPGPDGKAWYRITSELDRSLTYLIPPYHARLIPDEELTPIAPEVPAHLKRIQVSLARQTLTAYQDGEIVFQTQISSGIPSKDPVPKGTRTSRGLFNVTSKTPSKHMGSLLTGAPDSYTLPGVPWTIFFTEHGEAFHGTFWHNNFGLPMSHGCINMRNEEAQWLFRWVTPEWEIPPKNRSQWDRRGFGTTVEVI